MPGRASIQSATAPMSWGPFGASVSSGFGTPLAVVVLTRDSSYDLVDDQEPGVGAQHEHDVVDRGRVTRKARRRRDLGAVRELHGERTGRGDERGGAAEPLRALQPKQLVCETHWRTCRARTPQ